MRVIPGSASGRPPDSGSGNLGSNPSPGAELKKKPGCKNSGIPLSLGRGSLYDKIQKLNSYKNKNVAWLFYWLFDVACGLADDLFL